MGSAASRTSAPPPARQAGAPSSAGSPDRSSALRPRRGAIYPAVAPRGNRRRARGGSRKGKRRRAGARRRFTGGNPAGPDELERRAGRRRARRGGHRARIRIARPRAHGGAVLLGAFGRAELLALGLVVLVLVLSIRTVSAVLRDAAAHDVGRRRGRAGIGLTAARHDDDPILRGAVRRIRLVALGTVLVGQAAHHVLGGLAPPAGIGEAR